jgi:hypothetical protein
MSLDIGRKGWIGIGLQIGFQVPAAITDYVDFTANTLEAVQNQLEVDPATGLRDRLLSTVPGTNMSQGDVEIYSDSVKTGYFVVGALGTVQTVSLGSGVYRHTITRNNSSDPQFLTITSDRVKDRQLYPDVAVSQFNLSVGLDIVKVKSTVVGNFPQTTTSGTKTTTSGNVFNFANAQFAFGTTVSGAQSNTPLKPHDFTLNINNNTVANFAHSQNGPRSINHGKFEATADFNLYFENTTDRDAYYNQTKQAASFELYGNGIGGGFQESMVFNFYKTSVKTFTVETGIDNFFAEKVTLNCEFDTATQRTMDAVITNTKALYI